MREQDLTEKELNIYNNLKQQMLAEFKHIRTGSYQSKYRYKSAMEQWCMYLSKEFRSQTLNNKKGKHFQGFADFMKAEGKANATITTNLSGIRYYYDHTTRGRIRIPSNRELNVMPRTGKERINVNRAMPQDQYDELIDIAKGKGLNDIELQIKLGYVIGLRIHEILSIKRYDLKNSIYAHEKYSDKENTELPFILVKGKSGKIRKVFIETQEQTELLKEVYQYSDYKKIRVFENGSAMHKQIKRLQKFISNHRTEKKGAYKVTCHSLRHSFAQNMDKRLKEEGLSELERYKKISESTGHNRISASKVYIESVEDWNAEDE